MKANALRLAVFDCDGTLVDSQAMIVATALRAWDALDMLPPDEGDIRRLIGLPLHEAFARLVPEMDQGRLDELVSSYRAQFSQVRESQTIPEPLFPGMRETLEALEDAGWILGLATGKSMRGVRMTLRAHGLLDKFVTVQTADVAAGKPNPEMLLRAMKEAGADRHKSVMIGDTTFDMHMAQNAGTRAIGVAWGYHEVDELLGAGAEAIVTRGEDTHAVLAILMEES